jgi:transposase
MRVARAVILNSEQRQQLEQQSRARSLSARQVERARVVLRAADGWQDKDIASELGITPEKAARWRNRFLDGGLAALEKDAPRPGRPHTVSGDKVQEIVHKTTQEKPTVATHWSTRTMAMAVGVSAATVRRIWHANGLKPHLSRTFKVSNDPQFAEKLEAVVGLYLNPPEHALVFCVDEKSQIQARDRTQPGLPLKKGRCGTMTHDYKLQRYGHLIRGAQHFGWHRNQHVRRSAPPSRVAQVLTRDRRRQPRQGGNPLDRGQLRHPQTSEGATMAGTTPSVPHALHADEQFLAQHG